MIKLTMIGNESGEREVDVIDIYYFNERNRDNLSIKYKGTSFFTDTRVKIFGTGINGEYKIKGQILSPFQSSMVLKREDRCPDCDTVFYEEMGSYLCPKCGYSKEKV